jgi:hypothetical protein
MSSLEKPTTMGASLASPTKGPRDLGSVCLAAGALVGCVVALATLDPRFILGTGGKWLHPPDDFNAYLVAWNYFVTDAWRLPLFSLPMMSYPEGGNVLFNDALPLMALPSKLLFGLTGTKVNPFGWWILSTYVLQGMMAARVVRSVGARSVPAAVGAAVLAACATFFLSRMGHIALSSHFLILWALALYFENVGSQRTRLWEMYSPPSGAVASVRPRRSSVTSTATASCSSSCSARSSDCRPTASTAPAPSRIAPARPPGRRIRPSSAGCSTS